MLFISYSNGRISWGTGPLFLLLPLLLNSGLLPVILGFFAQGVATGGMLLLASLVLAAAAMRIAGRDAVLRQLARLSDIANGLLFGVRGQYTRPGAATAAQPGGAARAAAPGQGTVPGMDQVAATIQKLPILPYLPEEDLRRLSACQLKARLQQLHLSTDGFLEKGELVERLRQHGGSSSTSCSICCEDYAAGDSLRVLPCSHMFHVECIDRWYLSVASRPTRLGCPMCNTPLQQPHVSA